MKHDLHILYVWKSQLNLELSDQPFLPWFKRMPYFSLCATQIKVTLEPTEAFFAEDWC